MRSRCGQTRIGDGETDGAGAYTVSYRRRASLNLLARAYDAKGALIAESATMFAAPAQLEIDLTTAKDGVVRAPSRFTSVQSRIAAELHDVRLEDLKQDKDHHDLEFLASSIASRFDEVAYAFLARVLGLRHELRDETLFGISTRASEPRSMPR